MIAPRRLLPAVVVCGPPAAGKSTLGRALASRLDATVLDQDVLTAALTSVVATLLGTDDLDAPALASATRGARYETLLSAAEDNLGVGRPVILIAPFSAERRDRDAWGRLSARLAHAGGTAVMVWLRLSGAELVRRMTTRAAERDLAKLVDPAAYVARIDLAPPLISHIAIEAAATLDTQCAAVLAQLPSS